MTPEFNLSENIHQRDTDVNWQGNIEVKDVKEFIKRDYKNLVLAKRREISWQEYIRRRNELIGEKLR